MTGSVSSRRLLEPAPAVPLQLFYTVPGTNLTWPSDNGAGKDMRTLAIDIYLFPICFVCNRYPFSCTISLLRWRGFDSLSLLLARQMLSGIKPNSPLQLPHCNLPHRVRIQLHVAVRQRCWQRYACVCDLYLPVCICFV